MNAAIKLGGRVLLRSAGLRPWYIKLFEEEGFKAKQVMGRTPGAYIDR
jgi:betaine lipid synthase